MRKKIEATVDCCEDCFYFRSGRSDYCRLTGSGISYHIGVFPEECPLPDKEEA